MTISDEVFQCLYHEHFASCVSRFKRRGLTPEDAEDLAQKAFANAYQNRDKLFEINKFKYWLLAIEKNLWRNFVRDSQAVKRAAEEVPFQEERDSPEPNDDPLAQLMASETKAVLEDLIEQLPPQQKQVVAMTYYQNLTGEDIAAMLHINPKTVRTNLYFARKNLAKGLRELGLANGKPT